MSYNPYPQDPNYPSNPNYLPEPNYHTPAPAMYSNPNPVYTPSAPLYHPAQPPFPTAPQPAYDNTQYQHNYEPAYPQQNHMDYSTNTPVNYEFDYQQQPQHYSMQPQMFLGQMASNMSGETLAATALQFGPTLAASSKEYLDHKLDSFTSESRGVYKSYWDVDTTYVLKKLAYLLLPVSSDGSAIDGFSPPPGGGRSLNAPDLYIPSMSFVTYILMVGYVLGNQGRFAPNLLGITATSALVWLTIEIFVSLVATYITGMYSSGLWHRICVLSGYKFFYMVCCIGVFGIVGAYGYYIGILLTAVSSIIFTARSLKSVLDEQIQSPNRIYLSIAIAVVQPVMVYWLTWHLVHYT